MCHMVVSPWSRYPYTFYIISRVNGAIESPVDFNHPADENASKNARIISRETQTSEIMMGGTRGGPGRTCELNRISANGDTQERSSGRTDGCKLDGIIRRILPGDAREWKRRNNMDGGGGGGERNVRVETCDPGRLDAR